MVTREPSGCPALPLPLRFLPLVKRTSAVAPSVLGQDWGGLGTPFKGNVAPWPRATAAGSGCSPVPGFVLRFGGGGRLPPAAGMPGAEAGSILTPNAGDEQLPGGAEPSAPKPGETEKHQRRSGVPCCDPRWR